jgi:hypothetical protein
LTDASFAKNVSDLAFASMLISFVCFSFDIKRAILLFQLALPYAKHRPTSALEPLGYGFVALDIAADFLFQKSSFSLGRVFPQS